MENKTLSGGCLVSYDIYPKEDHTSILKGFMFFEYKENNVKNSKIKRLNEFGETIINLIKELPDVKGHMEELKKKNIETVIILNSVSKIL